MNTTDIQPVTLNIENQGIVTDAFKLVQDSMIPEKALKLRKRFREVPLYECIISVSLAQAFVRFVAGEIGNDHPEITSMIEDLQIRLHGDFSTSVVAMIHIIREELDIE